MHKQVNANYLVEGGDAESFDVREYLEEEIAEDHRP